MFPCFASQPAHAQLQQQTSTQEQQEQKPVPGEDTPADTSPAPAAGADATQVVADEPVTPAESDAARIANDEHMPVAAGAKKPAREEAASDIVVTGSQIRGSDPTSDLKIYTAEDIKSLGVSNVQDFIRSLPLNQASVGYGLNNRQKTEVKFDGGGLGGLGVAGVNLRGLGTRNTLVLVNGRRIAGAAGVEEGFANINTIPLAAVERVEISLSGNSAVYGADALGGVINFVLKKNYRGFSATARQELSSTGADTRQSTMTAATGWRSGSVTATLSYTMLEPVSNARLGYVTHDYREYISAAQIIAAGRSKFHRDQRSPLSGGQPAALVLGYALPPTRPDGPEDPKRFFYQYHGGNAVAQPGIGDLGPVNLDTLSMGIPPDAGEHQRSLGVSVSLDQKITDRLHLTIDYFGSRNHMYLRESHDIIRLSEVPLTQAYSPFKASDLPSNALKPFFDVYYDPRREYADGRLKPGFQDSTIWSTSVTTGLQYRFGPDAELRANYSYSENQALATEEGLQAVYEIDRHTGLCGVGEKPKKGVRNLEQVVARQCAALTSSDPAVAFNVLNDGSSRVGAPADIFFVHIQNLSNKAFNRSKDILLTFAPLKLPAGKVKVAIGTESFSFGTTGERIREKTEEDVHEVTAAGYAEARVPLVNAAMHVPLINAFDLSLKGRFNSYVTRGPVATVDNVPYEDGGKIVRGKASFSRISPDVGASWSPTPGLLFRGSWSSSFSPPSFTDLYNVRAGQTFTDILVWDPYAPDGNELQGTEYQYIYLANPRLRPSTSSSYHFGTLFEPHHVFQGLSVLVDYYNTVVHDRIGSTDDLAILMPRRDYMGLKNVWIRDADGYIVRKEIRPINVGSVLSESIDVAASYAFQLGTATVTPFVNYSRNLRQQFDYQGHVISNMLGTSLGLDRYRYELGLTVMTPTLSARLARRFIPAYDNTYGVSYDEGKAEDSDFDGVPDRPFPIHSLATYDLNVRWQPVRSLSASIGGRNIFNARPPFALIDSRPFDASRYDIRGRVLYAEARLQF
ncbi:TonB-dependent receptor domain-containing protein [Sphingomonas sp. 8AM]|uniref:TonB-dependent receptor domain-containing protein n=1 Tax=Sphingomonas sp. 8AM TaxID=2653170 RepID=UPI0012F053CB|nr:TonB-dependent receptor [Sphingomonas sp. 8AM]VXC61463.1 conserved hypothetical protein [Sphingomonas sp. 8AM]